MACCILYRGDVVPKDINGNRLCSWLYENRKTILFLHSYNFIIKS
jgi:hypothetical protein